MRAHVSLIITAICLVLMAPVIATADQREDKKAIISTSGTFEAYYKSQNNYVNPWDKGDNGDKQASNNRASQSIRQKGVLQVIGVGDFVKDGEVEYPKWLAITQIEALPDDPDANATDGQQNIDLAEYWLQYKPTTAINIKIGSQSILPTINGVNTHLFSGDIEQDFSFAQNATGVVTTPGLSVSAYLGSKDLELGLSMVDGHSGLSDLFGSDDEEGISKATILWLAAKFGDLSLNTGYQMVSTGGLETTSEFPQVKDQHKHEKSHNVMNFSLSYQLGWIKPYLGYQQISGDKASEYHNANGPAGSKWATALSAFNTGGTLFNMMQTNNAFGAGYTAISLQDIGLKEETSTGAISTIQLGAEVKLGPGMLAIDYVMANSNPAYGEADAILPIIDLKSVLQSEYTFQLGNGRSIGIFYHQLTVGDTMAKMLEKAKANQAAIYAESTGALSSQGLTTLADGVVNLLEPFQWSTSTSVGVAFNMKFGK